MSFHSNPRYGTYEEIKKGIYAPKNHAGFFIGFVFKKKTKNPLSTE